MYKSIFAIACLIASTQAIKLNETTNDATTVPEPDDAKLCIKEGIEYVFEGLDADNNGTISREEFEVVLKAAGEDATEEMVKRADKFFENDVGKKRAAMLIRSILKEEGVAKDAICETLFDVGNSLHGVLDDGGDAGQVQDEEAFLDPTSSEDEDSVDPPALAQIEARDSVDESGESGPEDGFALAQIEARDTESGESGPEDYFDLAQIKADVARSRGEEESSAEDSSGDDW